MSVRITRREMQQIAGKRFNATRALFEEAGFAFHRIRRVGVPMLRYFCTRNDVAEEFDTLADAKVWLAQHQAKKAALEAGNA
jgi:hypothetical protein